ncbi:MAG: hypothetical protein PF569_05820 [Candidatus Woesearchaeota archaeon]|jgi:molybdopterin-guanine dinucleotide biosynthesis protein|nr:hypothetical protein [Candidatus Woesearchaeota archaeon]
MDLSKRIIKLISENKDIAIQRGIELIEGFSEENIDRIVFGGDGSKDIAPKVRSYFFKKDVPEIVYYGGKIPQNSIDSPNTRIIYCP